MSSARQDNIHTNDNLGYFSYSPPRMDLVMTKHFDPVTFPKHYVNRKYEPLKVIEDWELGFHLGNVLKYLARADLKGKPIEDLEKAEFYLCREINKRKESVQKGK